MVTHAQVHEIFRRLAFYNKAISSFREGPGDYTAVNASDKLYPLLYLEQEQRVSTSGGGDTRSIAFTVLDRALKDSRPPGWTEDRIDVQTLDNCERIAMSVVARFVHDYERIVDEPFVLDRAAVPETGSDRVLGYRIELAIKSEVELDTCEQPYEDYSPVNLYGDTPAQTGDLQNLELRVEVLETAVAELQTAQAADAEAIAQLQLQAQEAAECCAALSGLVDGHTAEIAALTQRITDAESAIGQLRTDLDAETQARTDADTALSDAISTETSERQAADTALSADVASEEADRIAADANLQTQITTVQATADAALAARPHFVSFETGESQRVINPLNPYNDIAQSLVGSNTFTGARALLFSLEFPLVNADRLSWEVTVPVSGAQMFWAIYAVGNDGIPTNRLYNLGSYDVSVGGIKTATFTGANRFTLQAGVRYALAFGTTIALVGLRNTGACRIVQRSSSGTPLVQINTTALPSSWPATWAALGGTTTTATAAAISPFVNFREG